MIPVHKKRFITTNNKGFTLIELIVSIVVLAIVISPLLSHFVVSANINTESRKQQNHTILAQNLMEEAKYLTIEELSVKYGYPGYEAIAYEEGPIYFIKENMEYQGAYYDVKLILDGTAYRGTDGAGNPVGYNTVPMPELDEIGNEDVVAAEAYEEELAVAALFGNHASYCMAEEILHEGDPLFHITYNTPDEIRSKLEKSITINLQGFGSDILAEVNMEYSCPSYPGCDAISYRLLNRVIPNRNGDVYVFYYPSFQDRITIIKEPLLTEDISIHIFQQNTVQLSVNPEIISIPDGIRLYSNISFPGIPAAPMRKVLNKNRICQVRIQLFTAGAHFNPEELLLELQSTKEG